MFMRMYSALALLESVYGPVDTHGFPRALPPQEAGRCANGDGCYLWTDAFAVLAFTTISDTLERDDLKFGDPARYRRAADALVEAVHEGLGKPCSASALDAMRPDGRSPTGFVGLRIGKLRSAAQTDVGMSFDGQYRHYMDKWLLALVRAGRADEAVAIAKVVFPCFFDPGRQGDGRDGGILWKLSEIGLLRNALIDYAIFDGFVDGYPRTTPLARVARYALDPRHLSLHFRLYGALLGARVASSCARGRALASVADMKSLLALSLEQEAEAEAGDEPCEHSSINRVMLAACCVATPGSSFGRRAGEPLVKL
ncbi:hypothetical protein T492DRAFT_854344 [Pavlovales sp. CCMP2436]|nr:hypothetical protein T492DRAFT_854344 [Pavlovales sp. CCMP2436]